MERVPAQDNGQLHLIIQLGDKIQMTVDRLPIAQGPEDIRQAQSLPASSELYLRPMDKLIQTAGSSALPVLIQGAVGTHKGVVARRIHTKSATEGTTLMRLQCRDLTEKNWDMQLNNAASPIHATGYTVYLENVDTLPKDLQQHLIMMYDGRIVIDVSGEEKKKLTVPDLLALFSKVSGSDEADDKLLLS